ncbi:hypothetical protein BN874_2800002 [Candidatus Contendobacter odensis Run_B_J11]|uniref:Uncharacterized protein n=1 Tax=Candidatus Contendobacter odensis Run_B_J11 TaxID=1400861 RepID=A0A7U7J4V7_9GAMM|nr:hypothetical protein BN874_2800002 [Candidatus Contendobacter odensis Run_B_J11]
MQLDIQNTLPCKIKLPSLIVPATSHIVVVVVSLLLEAKALLEQLHSTLYLQPVKPYGHLAIQGD